MSDENIETTEQTTDESGASRDDLLAAVREAGGTESVDVAGEEAAAKPAETPATPAETAPEDPDAKIAAILEKRREEHEKITRAERMLRDAEERAARIQAEAKERADREWQAELERRRKHFAENPTEAVRALGDPEKIGDAIIADGTPEARARRELEARLAKAESKAETAEQVKAEIEAMKREREAERVAAINAKVRDEYLSQFASPEKTPYLHARWDQDEIFARSVALAKEWAAKGAEYKKDFDDHDVALYLEQQSKKRITALQSPAQQVSAGAPAKEPGNAPKVSANGSRTLSAAAGSERRTSPRPLNELSPREARDELIREVEAARRANPDAKY